MPEVLPAQVIDQRWRLAVNRDKVEDASHTDDDGDVQLQTGGRMH